MGTWQKLLDGGGAVVQVTTRAAGGSFAAATDIGPTVVSGIGAHRRSAGRDGRGGHGDVAFPSDDRRIRCRAAAARRLLGALAEVSTGTANDNVDLAVSPPAM